MLNRRTVITSAAAAAAGAVLAGCSDSNPRWAAPGSSIDANGGVTPPKPVTLLVTPAANTHNVSPADAVTVSAVGGTLTSVTVTGAGGHLAGELATDQSTWRSTDPLGYGRTYTVTVSAVNAGGTTFRQTSTFTTVKAKATAGLTFQASAIRALTPGGTYGVGQPVAVNFSQPVSDHAAAEAAMQVVAEPAVDGRWHWLDNQNAHWRPQNFWAAGTKVSVEANLLGVNLGNGVYGKANTSINFSIGPARIAVADSNTHYMTVTVNGTQVKNMPVSMGKGGTVTGSHGEVVNFWTTGGVHVVVEKLPTTTMSSASYGITDPKDPNYYKETVSLCVRISFSGEFVHSAPWSVADQGHTNVSHGCINISPANAQWFYNNFQLGDVVIVKNTPRQLQLWNGLGDWNVPWSQW